MESVGRETVKTLRADPIGSTTFLIGESTGQLIHGGVETPQEMRHKEPKTFQKNLMEKLREKNTATQKHLSHIHLLLL